MTDQPLKPHDAGPWEAPDYVRAWQERNPGRELEPHDDGVIYEIVDQIDPSDYRAVLYEAVNWAIHDLWREGKTLP